MKINNCFAAVVASAVLVLSGCASTHQTSTAGPGAPLAASTAEVPALKVAVDCGACLVKPTIPALIVAGYNEAAGKAGRNVSATKEARLTIKEYTSRSDAARFLVGALAGKDEIKAVIAYEGKTYAVEDYYRNAWLGIDTLAKNIGEKSYVELK